MPLPYRLSYRKLDESERMREIIEENISRKTKKFGAFRTNALASTLLADLALRKFVPNKKMRYAAAIGLGLLGGAGSSVLQGKITDHKIKRLGDPDSKHFRIDKTASMRNGVLANSVMGRVLEKVASPTTPKKQDKGPIKTLGVGAAIGSVVGGTTSALYGYYGPQKLVNGIHHLPPQYPSSDWRVDIIGKLPCADSIHVDRQTLKNLGAPKDELGRKLHERMKKQISNAIRKQVVGGGIRGAISGAALGAGIGGLVYLLKKKIQKNDVDGYTQAGALSGAALGAGTAIGGIEGFHGLSGWRAGKALKKIEDSYISHPPEYTTVSKKITFPTSETNHFYSGNGERLDPLVYGRPNAKPLTAVVDELVDISPMAPLRKKWGNIVGKHLNRIHPFRGGAIPPAVNAAVTGAAGLGLIAGTVLGNKMYKNKKNRLKTSK